MVQAGAHRRLKRPDESGCHPRPSDRSSPLMGATETQRRYSIRSVPSLCWPRPATGVPIPAHTSCLRVHGRSMMPLIHDGYIIVVDTSQTNRLKLYGQIVVAAHKEQGLVVSRLQRFDHTEVLVPENREYESTSVSTHGWRIVAKVLWWIGRAAKLGSLTFAGPGSIVANRTAMNIVKATHRFEEWLGRHTTLMKPDLRLKHQHMADAVFPFLRATFYRWMQIWPEICPDLAKAPHVLAVGDLHVENFGTWRDLEGRLVWGVNDFDEGAPRPTPSIWYG